MSGIKRGLIVISATSGTVLQLDGRLRPSFSKRRFRRLRFSDNHDFHSPALLARLAAKAPLHALTNAFSQNKVVEAKTAAPAAALSAAGFYQPHTSHYGNHN